MIPLSETEQREMAKGNFAVSFSVHKYNSYIQGRTITLQEAAKCVVYQSKWAASRELILNGEKLAIDVQVLSEIDVKGMGKFVVVSVATDQTQFQCQFIVSESETNWFFFDYGLARVAASAEIGQGLSGTATIAEHQ
jgi:hypothetical protein